MMVRTFPLLAVCSMLALAVAGCSSAASSDPGMQQQKVQQAFDGLKDSLGLARGHTALAYIDGPTLDFLNGVATKPADPSAPDINELLRRSIAKLTPGGVQPGFTIESPVQHVLDAGWISPTDLDGLRLGPITLEAGETQAHAELFWLGNATTIQLQFARDKSGAWKIDLLNLLPYGEAAMRTERTLKNETVTQQIDRLVGQITVP